MTLLVALKAKDGVVAVCDSRGTFGDPRGVTAQNDSQKKAHIVAPHVAVMIAGAGEIGTQLIQEITAQAQASAIDGVTNVTNLVRNTARQRYAEWFPHLHPAVPPGVQAIARPDLAFVVAGYDAGPSGEYDVPKLYSCISQFDFPPMVHEYGFALQGVVQYALYLLNRLYEPGRQLAEIQSLGVYVITETASQDGKVGGPVQVVAIRPKDGAAALSDGDVETINKSNTKRAAKLRQSFYAPNSGKKP